jgi:hypothetical protein
MSPPQEEEFRSQVRALVEGRTPARFATWGLLFDKGNNEEWRVSLEARARPNYGDATVTVERFKEGQDAGSTRRDFTGDDGTDKAVAYFMDQIKVTL